MKVPMALIHLGLLSLAAAQTKNHPGSCANEILPPPTWLDPVRAAASNGTAQQQAITTIRTYMHLVGRNATTNAVAAARVSNTLAALNRGFNQVGFQFRLAAPVDRRVSPVQAVAATMATELRMKSTLRRGTYADLNLYFLSDFKPDEFRLLFDITYGVCRYPTLGYTRNDFNLDGCIILQNAMTGSPLPEASLGNTVVHEVGHWLGLIHVWGELNGTLDPDCLDDDEIFDTPRQRDPTSGCPAPIGTPGPQSMCPGVTASDNIHNFMDYADDVCLNEFTPRQISVMNTIYNTARRPFRVLGLEEDEEEVSPEV
jgi:hypothetical protein